MPEITITKVPYGQGHRYQVKGDERVNPSQSLSTVSTIARHADAGGGDGLLYWAVDAYRETGVRNGFKLKGENAMAIGTALHTSIDEYITTGEQPMSPSPLFGAWYSSLHEAGIAWYDSEVMVYSPDGFGGTVDAIGYLDGVATLFDWKTTDQYSWPKDSDGNPKLDKQGQPKAVKKRMNNAVHATQIGGYLWAMQMMADQFPGMPQPTQAYVIYVFKDTLTVEWKAVNLDKSMEAFQVAHKLYTLKGGLYA